MAVVMPNIMAKMSLRETKISMSKWGTWRLRHGDTYTCYSAKQSRIGSKIGTNVMPN